MGKRCILAKKLTLDACTCSVHHLLRDCTALKISPLEGLVVNWLALQVSTRLRLHAAHPDGHYTPGLAGSKSDCARANVPWSDVAEPSPLSCHRKHFRKEANQEHSAWLQTLYCQAQAFAQIRENELTPSQPALILDSVLESPDCKMKTWRPTRNGEAPKTTSACSGIALVVHRRSKTSSN